MKTRAITIALSTFGIAALAGCSSSSPEALCKNYLEEELGSSTFSGALVTESIDSPIQFDIRGKFDRGEFSCGLSRNPTELTNVIVFWQNGDVEVLL